ncbi:MAG: amphi-Trp domain-containing protein [Deltaproteobacteria bacterium]|jgi:amphi-Trp domain-containing protein|nr:amphi-Trp domain-containing protein [Deltaproteobacteria bacterium]
MTRHNFNHSFVSDPDEVVAFLESLIEGFKNRSISIGADGREIVLKPAEILDLTLETMQRKGRQRLTLTVNWPETEPPAGSHRGSGTLFPPARANAPRPADEGVPAWTVAPSTVGTTGPTEAGTAAADQAGTGGTTAAAETGPEAPDE